MLLSVPAIALLLMSTRPEGSPRELGDVRFGRDLDAALAEARRVDRPVLILFDEIPGCSTCTGYGETVLAHPLIVEAAESLFVPVAIYNNKSGKDAEVLASFGEPSWNNPVVRIVDAERRALVPRVNGDYTPAGLARAMVGALEAVRKPVPEYLRLLAMEAAAERAGTVRAVLGMYCFWQGEACLGGIEGVVRTRAGFLEGREVVEVEADPARLDQRGLLAEASKRRCMSEVFVRSDGEERVARDVLGVGGVSIVRSERFVRGSEKDDKYHLAQTAWRYVPMTAMQAMRANALIARGADPAGVFSPRQLRIHDAAARRALPDALGKENLRELFELAERS